MRLIDADALKRQYEDHKRLFCRNRIEFSTLSDKDKARVDELDNCIADILNAPTIEERKTGKWVERNPQNSDRCRLIECDQCGFAHIVGFNVPYEHWVENRNFCERCGADMRKEGDTP